MARIIDDAKSEAMTPSQFQWW